MADGEVWQGNKAKHLSKNPLLRWLLKRFNDDVSRLATAAGPTTILDVGCGEGFTTQRVADALPSATITAYDIESNYIEDATTHSARRRIVYRVGDLFSLPIPAEAEYDLVMSNEALEHIENYREALERLTRFSRRFVLISVPNEPWFRMANMFRGKYLGDWGNTPGHVNHWTRRDLERLVGGYGTVVAVRNTSFMWNVVLLECRPVLQGA